MLKFLTGLSEDLIEENIQDIDDAIRLIEKLIQLKDRDKAILGVQEIKEKENKSYNKYTGKNNDNEKKRKNNFKKFNLIFKRLDRLTDKIIEQKSIDEKKEKEQKEKIQIQNIKNEINNLIKQKKTTEANQILNELFNTFKTKPHIVIFYNKERKKILKIIEKEKKIKEKEIQKDARKQAQELSGEILTEQEEEKNHDSNKGFFSNFVNPLKIIKKIKNEIGRKKLLDEVNLMIGENMDSKSSILATKMAHIHKGLIKEVQSSNKMQGYEIYGRILGNEKVSGDVIGLTENKKNSLFFFGDATGHGIKAGLMVSLLTQEYDKICKTKGLIEVAFAVNNRLKQDLQSGNFITGVLFEVINNNLDQLKFVGMGHEPMFLYRDNTKKAEKVIPGGLAAGIRKMKDTSKVKEKVLEFGHNDIIMTYSDGINEAKSVDGEMYGFPRLQQNFNDICKITTDLKKIYQSLIDSLVVFTGSNSFYDDVSIMLIKRDHSRDVIDTETEIEKMAKKEGLDKKEVKKIKGKTREEIHKEFEKIKKEKDLKNILKSLDILYQSRDYIKLKQESIRFIKEGFIHKKINQYLKQSIDNENKHKIQQKNKKVATKYDTLIGLYKKGDYETVISECSNIITKDGNI